MVFVKRIIAEYELRDVDKRTLSFRSVCGRWASWLFLLKSLWRTWLWLIPLVGVAVYAWVAWKMGIKQQCLAVDMFEWYTDAPLTAAEIMPYVAREFLNAEACLCAVGRCAVELFGIVLIYRLFLGFSAYISAMRAPFAVAQGVGLGSVEVMRLTHRGCLLVGRRSGVCMRFPWADFTSAKVEHSVLCLRNQKTGQAILLPLPLLYAEEQCRLQRELDAVFAAPPAAAPTAPPADAELWKGAKPADLILPGIPRCRTFIYRLRGSFLVLWGALSTLLIGVLLCCGFVPKLVCVFVAYYMCALAKNTAASSHPAVWRYLFGRVCYRLYPPFGGVCRVSRSLLQAAVELPRVQLLRLRGDAVALLPAKKADAPELPRVKYRGVRRLFLYALLAELALVILYWDEVFNCIFRLVR